MSLRLFADHCVPRSVITDLRAAGHEVLILTDHIPAASDDQVVIAKAQDLDAILISLNGDFADLVAYPPFRYKGIISLQVRNHPEILPAVMQRLLDYLAANHEATHYSGKLLIVEPHRIRVRR
jgi:predicted nuclease of predicted toxin-antitoxin system